MEDTSMSSSSEIDLPGFRFHPTEEELLDFYLKNTVFGKKLRFDVIGCLNIYHHDPWDLPGLSKVGEREWYFFVPRECRKHGNGGRPNRTTERGFWKATGSDRKILNSNCVVLGLKKTLVFYEGRAPKGTKTDWIMNEYRLPDHSHPLPKDMVLCKIYRKATSFRVLEQRAVEEEQQLKAAANQTSSSSTEMDSSLCWQEDESLALSQQLVPLKREAPEDDGSGSEALQLQFTQKKAKPPPSPSSTTLQMPLGYDPLPELQLPITNQFDWTQDQLWTQFNSPWLQNWGHYANILNF